MGTASYVLVGTSEGMRLAFGSACHGAGRRMSRHKAYKTWIGRQVIDELAQRGILIRSPSSRGVAEEAPGAYKEVSGVVDATDEAGLARKVARLEPVICIKGYWPLRGYSPHCAIAGHGRSSFRMTDTSLRSPIRLSPPPSLQSGARMAILRP